MAFNAPHPAGMQPPGMPHGQPMGPGQGHPGPVGPQMGIHAGVSGPAGPHGPQAGPMMAGMQMQPGVGGPGAPNAHAMAHLQNQQMMPQQMQQASKSAQSMTDFTLSLCFELLIQPIQIPCGEEELPLICS